MNQCPFGTGRTRRWIPWASIAVPTIGWLVFGLYPSLATIYYSFTQYSGLPGTPLDFCGLCNYRNAFQGSYSDFSAAIETTVKYAGGVAVLQIGLGLGLALLLKNRRRGFGLYRALIFMPQIFSVTVVGILFSMILDPQAGPAEKGWTAVLGSANSFLGSSTWALPLCILINVWMFTGYTMLVYIAGLRRIPQDVYEAASLDGAGRWRTFRSITWPLLAPATTVNVFLTVVGCLGEYALILVLTDGQFGTQTIGFYMFNAAFGQNPSLGYGSMLAMAQFALTLMLGGGLLWGLRRREVAL
ncbi:sugar ABC transporter permease [Actinospica durhamensis]|uniref:Sugar ABC transporter permease n=1 Tax=Actinospica durhamensis TaxID=1508375 RepID=A0A941ISN6_9ACTN|nr:sugar ABC transporter permease [Actinospica durhamensis]MBR7836592.1 sugar ABC transporter permease [Actinospica durhamensis]